MNPMFHTKAANGTARTMKKGRGHVIPAPSKAPNKLLSLKFSCAGFTIWVTGDKRTISIGVSEILAGFKHQDEFCTIDSEKRLKLKKESIEIGTVGQRHYSILLSECDYSFWELCEYFKALCEGDE